MSEEHERDLLEKYNRLWALLQKWDLSMDAEIERMNATVWRSDSEGIAFAQAVLKEMLIDDGFELWEF